MNNEEFAKKVNEVLNISEEQARALVDVFKDAGWTPPPDEPDILDEVWVVHEYATCDEKSIVDMTEADRTVRDILVNQSKATDAQLDLMAAAPEMAKLLKSLYEGHGFRSSNDIRVSTILRKAGVIPSS